MKYIEEIADVDARNLIVYSIYVENVGRDPLDSVQVRLRFPNRDGKILQIFPFESHPDAEATAPPRLYVRKEPYAPYLPFGYQEYLRTIIKRLASIPEGVRSSDLEKEIIQVALKELARRLSKIYGELPSSAHEIEYVLQPLRPKDRGIIRLIASVENIDAFQLKPPILAMDAKSSNVKVDERKYGAIEYWTDYFLDHLWIFLLLIISVSLNIFLTAVVLRNKSVTQ